MVFGFDIGGPPASGLMVSPDQVPDPAKDIDNAAAAGDDIAVLGGGCFWCVEGVYRLLDAVTEVVSGYAGGAAETASYNAICRGDTNHAEVVLVRFNPARISYGRILKIFFAIAHDPTQLNRQGNDLGTQYRSAIFYRNEAQREVAESYIRQLDEAGVFSAPIVTEIAELDEFYPAEDYHQDYAARNPAQPYIACFSVPKTKKLRSYFPEMLKGRGAA